MAVLGLEQSLFTNEYCRLKIKLWLRRLYSTTSPLGVTKAHSTRRMNSAASLWPQNVENETALRVSCFLIIQSPLRLRANSHSVERSHGCHGNCSSLPREARVQAIPRAKGSPMHTYTSVEITNVWTGLHHPHFSSSYHCLRSYGILTVYYWNWSAFHFCWKLFFCFFCLFVCLGVFLWWGLQVILIIWSFGTEIFYTEDWWSQWKQKVELLNTHNIAFRILA